jgi:dolichol kinase
MNLLLALAAYAVLFMLVEAALRLSWAKPESTRRIAHILAGVVTALLPYRLSFSQIALLGLILIMTALLSLRAGLFRSIHGVVRRTRGEIYFPSSIVLLALLFPQRNAFVYSFMILGLSDGAASLVGSRIGGKAYRLLHPETSREGSIAFFAVTAVLGLVLGMGLIPALFAALLLTFIEGRLIYGYDNLALPPAAAILFVLLR